MTRLVHLARSAFARVVAGYVLIAVVLAGAWVWSLSGPLTDAVIAQQEKNLTAVAQSAALLAAASEDPPQQIAAALVARTDLRLTIVAANGAVLADSDADVGQMENHADRPEIATALDGDIGVARRLSETEGDERLYVAVPGTLGAERVAVRVSQSLADVGAMASDLRRFGLVLLVLALAVSLGIGWRMTRLAVTPVRELTDAAQQMAQGDLAARVPSVPSDLEPLAEALSALKKQMRARLEALETERRTLRTALDGLADAVLMLEGDSVLLANRAAERLTGRGGAASRPLEELGLPASVEAAIRQQSLGPQESGIELEPDPLGRTRRVLVVPLDRSQADDRRIVVIRDVTERARLDLMRREFVANASHELKTPVAGIKLLADSALQAASDGDAEHAAVFTKQIAAEVERLRHLVGDLLDLSRLESLPASGEVTDVRAALDNAMVSHKARAQAKNLVFTVDMTGVRDQDIYVSSDATDLAIALDNLIDNAINYTDEGSVTVAVDADERDVAISVRDTGPGIEAAHLPRIFERFYRVDRGRSREQGGTGLGLALVRHVAEKNGGTVSVDSEVGAGTTFALRLPRAQ